MRILIHSRDLILTRDMRRRIEGRVRVALTALEEDINTVTVRLVDLDQEDDEIEVSIRIEGANWESCLVESHAEYLKALDRALARAERALERRIRRSRRRATSRFSVAHVSRMGDAAEQNAS